MNGQWWRDGVVYQVYPRSFADASGDGVGDLAGLTARLDHIAGLGADAIWLTPFQRSPQADHGYDVSDYTDVDPLFGDLAGFDAMLARAHDLGLRVIVDIVPNHCSDQHPVFQAALAGDPSARARFHFAVSPTDRPDAPPNNWPSVFGGPAWTRTPDGSWYLHLYAPAQPDWNWRDPRTAVFFDDVLRFWLDRGVDGLRIDVAHGLFKAAGLPSLPPGTIPSPGRLRGNPLACDQPETIEIYRRWRTITDSYDPPRVLIGEVNLPPHRAARYVGDDRLHQAFAFEFLIAPWDAATWRDTATRLLHHPPVTWVVENHDVIRTATRYSSGPATTDHPRAAQPGPPQSGPAQPGATQPGPAQPGPPQSGPAQPGATQPGPAQPGAARTGAAQAGAARTGAARARAALLTILGLPGAAYLYQGQEYSLPEADVPPSARQDPAWRRSGFSRDGCRVPLPWPDGFSSPGSAPPWLPVPAGWDGHLHSPTLDLTRTAIALRRRLRLSADDPVTWTIDHDQRLVARRPAFTLVIAMGTNPVPLPPGRVLLTSDPLTADGLLPPDTAAWLTH